MNISILNRSQINDGYWDACIKKSESPLVYGLSWYLDIVCEKWEGVVLKSENGYDVVMPIPVLNKWLFRVVRNPLFCQQSGVFYKKGVSIDVVHLIFQKALNNYRYINPLHLNYSCSAFISPFRSAFSFHETSYTNHVLPLSDHYERLFQSYRRDRKKDIRKAKAVGQKVIEFQDLTPIISMFKESVEPKFSEGIHANTFEYLTAIFEQCRLLNMGKLYCTQYEDGSYGASAFFVFWKNRIIYLFNAAYSDKRKDNGRQLILDHIISEYANSEWVLDFESPNNEQAITEFYQSFGAKEEVFQTIHYENLPKVITYMRLLKKKLLKSIF